jgi:hypothetical protein
MSQCYIPSLHVVHFKGALNCGEAQQVRERLERSRRELALMPDVFSATAELAAAIGEISEVSELLERQGDGSHPQAMRADSAQILS